MKPKIAKLAGAALVAAGFAGTATADIIVDPDGQGLTKVYPPGLALVLGTSPSVSVSYLYVGYEGQDGSLEVNADNVVDTLEVYGNSQIGASLTTGNGAGFLRVVGDGTADSANVIFDNRVAVGIGGNSRIDITNGGRITAAEVQLGSAATVDADILVDGPYSLLETTAGPILFSGEAPGAGRSLTVSGGAMMQARGVYDGIFTPGDPYNPGDINLQKGDRLTVTGTNSLALFEVNVHNRGTIEVLDGAVLAQDEPVGVIDTFTPIDPRGVMSMRVGAANTTARLRVAGTSDVYLSRSLRIGGYKEFVDVVPDGSGGYQWISTGASGEVLVETGSYLTVDGDLIVSENVANLDIASNEVLLAPGDGHLTVRSGGQVYVGGTLIVNEGGLLDGDGSIIGNVQLDGGTIAPGNSPGTLNIFGDLEILGGTLDIEVGYSDQDVLDVWGNVSFAPGTTVNLHFIEGYAPTAGEYIDFLFANDVTGTDNVSFMLFGLQDGFQYRVDTSIGLGLQAMNDAVSAVPVPAAFWLFGSGLLGMLGIARRQRKQS
ncbi:hypothetical protein QVG61_04095 [Thiohalobacter sp. IOR34]|uniref:hypothetical protein n=1 Tax=Thiohalobacter sp. IOR34 TaxID=3057176 RepID=UPI0025B06A66|nr:hypothetical protein [Thiohalobacter sp. IOR34]WJW76282.1 hypothetical protein QVG61_04095 [Thiohalobacter sp. IOR34]